MVKGVLGLHHVTAISSEPQKTLDFYTKILGLRLIKLTVNYDDPSTFHVYFGDEIGRPGTVLTFFPWTGQPRGRKGTGQATNTSFSIQQESIPYWQDRLKSHGVSQEATRKRFGETVLSFEDQDGQGLELVGNKENEGRAGWTQGPVPREHAIRGFHSVTLSEEMLERTESVLVDTLGFQLVGQEENRFRYEAGKGAAGTIVDIVSRPNAQRGFGERRNSPSYCVPRRRRRTPEGAASGDRKGRPKRDPGDQSELLSLHLLPRARWSSLRGGHRPARIRYRRISRAARDTPRTPTLARTIQGGN